MASKLCCTAEQEGRPGSPELPNVRISDATPAKRPLLGSKSPRRPESAGSRFTSARSEDLHELQQIFDNAKDSEDSKQSSPIKAHHVLFPRPSMYSLHSLHKMKSLHAIIKRKFSRDLVKPNSNQHLKNISPKKPIDPDPDTVVKVPREGPNLQLKITKSHLRKDLLSGKQPDEGGYDPDAEVLDDIAKNIGKKTPAKRPSIHSVDWTSSPGSKQTPASSNGRRSPDVSRDSQPYQIKQVQPQSATKSPISARFGYFTSSPNLRVKDFKSRDRKLRRSHSTSTIDTQVPTAAAPTVQTAFTSMRLPSMTMLDSDAIPWSTTMHESLRLSQFPIPPRHPSAKPSRSSLRPNTRSADTRDKQPTKEPTKDPEGLKEAAKVSSPGSLRKTNELQIHVHQPTSLRPSGSVHDSFRRDLAIEKKELTKQADDESEEDNSRRSVHLYSMRISHHLRSGSLLSWENLADGPEMPTPTRPIQDRPPSNHSRVSQLNHASQRTRHERQTSSSGFASSRVPSKWGRVLPPNRDPREEMSSIYSSPPQSPPDSFGGSTINLSRSGTHLDSLQKTVSDLTQRRHSDSFPHTDNEETPRPTHRYGITNLQAVARAKANNPLLENPMPLARNNSVANTKKSKFREEFSPSPPRKKSSTSVMKFLNPKRSSVRSQSETILTLENVSVDGPFDQPHTAPHRERRLSRSLMSLQTEQYAVGKEKISNPVWEKALKAHQEERSSFFLPQNKDLATQGNPFRERSGSVMKSRASLHEESSSIKPLNASKRLSVPFLQTPSFQPAKRFSAPLLEPPAPDDEGSDSTPTLFKRRTAIISREKGGMCPGQEVQAAFDKQTDDATTVGAWGRYPSQTRPDRTHSAGHLDNVNTRDFALEKALAFAQGARIVDEEIDPTAHLESLVLVNGKKRKKRVGSGRMAKSNSMTFGKQFLKNYTKIFRSQSTEFQRHGHGHRSSITTGGTLEYPELEILPEVWRRGIAEERSRDNSDGSQEAQGKTEGSGDKDKKGKGKMKAEDSMATLRPRHDNLSNSANALDGVAKNTPTDRARVWSVFYEDCVPNFPRGSLDWNRHLRTSAQDLELQEFGRMSARYSSDNSRGASFSRTMPARLGRHSRHGSRLSRASIVSHSSARPSCVSMGEGEEGDLDGVDEKSMVSVRQSCYQANQSSCLRRVDLLGYSAKGELT